MSRRLVLLFSFFLSSSLFAEPPAPVIESIEPVQGRVQGGDRVTITGRNFDGGPCEDFHRCGPAVAFTLPHPDGCCVSGVGKIISATDTQIVIETPEHATGLTHVTVVAKSGAEATVPNAYRFGREGYRRILVPIAFSGEVPGANGSRWVSELRGRVFYPGTVEVSRTPAVVPQSLVQGPFTFTDLPSSNRGMFLYVTEGHFLTMNLRVRDVSRDAENFGTEVPLVTAEESTTAFAFDLLDIPVGPKYRQTLRVYNFEGRRGVQIGVRVLARGGTENLVFAHYVMPEEEPIQEFPQFPGYLEINLADLLPANYAGNVDVSVSHPAGPRMWAMVSVTNNETQLVTMVTPTFNEHGFIAFIP